MVTFDGSVSAEWPAASAGVPSVVLGARRRGPAHFGAEAPASRAALAGGTGGDAAVSGSCRPREMA